MRYRHSTETHVVDRVVTEDGKRFLISGQHEIEVHPQCPLKAEDTIDKYLPANLRIALEQGLAGVLIHSNPIVTCQKCPFNGQGCLSVAHNALEDIGLPYKVFKSEI